MVPALSSFDTGLGEANMPVIRLDDSNIIIAIDSVREEDVEPDDIIVQDGSMGVGWQYDPATSTARPPKPYPSWIWGEQLLGNGDLMPTWVPPIDRPYCPNQGEFYAWDEEHQGWYIDYIQLPGVDRVKE